MQAVRRTYQMGSQPLHALDGIDLEVAAGRFVVLMGPSGSGKSTLLNIIGCLDRPSSGSYRLDGEEVTDLAEPELVWMRRHKLGFVFQTFHLVPRMDALGNVELPLIFSGVPPAERRERARRQLEAVGLGARVEHRPDELSGGERQRVAIARALVMSPPVLLADEPTGNLDSASGAEIIKLLRELNAQGHTIVMVTHDAALAGIGHLLVRLRDGRIEELVPA